MVHMGVALRDLANGTDNAKSLRDDWDRRTNPHGESKEQYKARTEASREADKSAMIVEELKLDRTNYRFGEIIREYSSFFANKERREKLTKLIEQPESIDGEEFKLSILTVISGAKTVDILEIIKNIILNKSKLEDIEKWMSLDFLFTEIKKDKTERCLSLNFND